MPAVQYPKRLYHYTTAGTLLAILQNRTFRLCATNTMNDRADGTYYLQTIINWARANGRPRVQRMFEKELKQVFFTLCFTYMKDDAAQWERYADRGRGVALVVDGSVLARWCRAHALAYDKVQYIPEFEVEWIARRKPDIIEQLEKLEATPEVEDAHFSVWLMHDMCAAAVCYKHGSFQSEQEYRVSTSKLELDMAPEQTAYFSKGGVVTEYVDYSIETGVSGGPDIQMADLIKGVIIGPSNPLDEVDMLALARHYGLGFNPNQVQKSTCPLRG